MTKDFKQDAERIIKSLEEEAHLGCCGGDFCENYYTCEQADKNALSIILKALQDCHDKARKKMCSCPERDVIDGDCDVCAEIIKVGGEQYKRAQKDTAREIVQMIDSSIRPERHQLLKEAIKKEYGI